MDWTVQRSLDTMPENKKNREDSEEKWEKLPWVGEQAESIKASRKAEDTDDPLDKYVYDPIAIRLTKGFIRAGLSANAATFCALLSGLAGAGLLWPQSRLINLAGMVLLFFSAVLDCSDGQIARLTHTSSQLGRVLDGVSDSIIYIAIYLVLGMKMMGETIPFTQRPWSGLIWIPVVLAMYCHAGQARMADYCRGLHLYFLKGKNKADLTRSKDLKEEIAALPGDTPLFERLYRVFYLPYTKNQEKNTPRTQRLLDKLEENSELFPRASRAFIPGSRQHIHLTWVIAFNLRTYVLFLLLLLRLQVLYFPFVILVMEAFKWLMVARYEALAGKVRDGIS